MINVLELSNKNWAVAQFVDKISCAMSVFAGESVTRVAANGAASRRLNASRHHSPAYVNRIAVVAITTHLTQYCPAISKTRPANSMVEDRLPIVE
jgi:hypothetical protein